MYRLIVIFLLGISSLYAVTGEEIINKAEQNASFLTSEGIVSMVIAKGGETKERLFKITQKNKDNTYKTLIKFFKPASVKGSALLSIQKDDIKQQFLYMPANKITKRLSTSERAGSFMGSDFNYDDFGGYQGIFDRNNYLGDKKVEGVDCYIVESYPKDENYHYAKIITWFDKTNYFPVKIEYYDSDGEKFKELFNKSIVKQDGYYCAREAIMKNYLKQQSTTLKLLQISYNEEIPDIAFSESALTR